MPTELVVCAVHAQQPVTLGVSLADMRSACRRGTYLGTDCGPTGSGMWHSLAGLLEDKDDCLDFSRCYPLLRAEYQPSCVGVTLRVKGAGSLRLELKAADGSVLWWASGDLAMTDEWQELAFTWEPDDLRKVKSLEWMIEPLTQVDLDSLNLDLRMPEVPFEEEVFLLSYAKLARLYSAESGLVRERAFQAVGARDSVAASGLFCLATSVACRLGLVKQAQAEQILHKVYAAVSDIQRAGGLLPSAVCREGGKLRIHDSADYSTLDTSLYYHSVLLAAQLLWDGKTLAGVIKAIREIDFDRLRDPAGYILAGLKHDGQTPLTRSWCDWCGEATLVLLMEQLCRGGIRSPRLKRPGLVPDGVGLSAELPGLFYLDFCTDEADAVTGVGWSGARRAHLAEQIGYFPRKRPKSLAARLGLYGLSWGEDPAGDGFLVGGTRMRTKSEVIRPHYVLMSGLVQSRPEAAYQVLRTMREHGLIQPWGMVGGFSADLEHSPLVGSFSAGLECLAAYHLWAEVSGRPDYVYAAVEDCGLLREAVRVFYPQTTTW